MNAPKEIFELIKNGNAKLFYEKLIDIEKIISIGLNEKATRSQTSDARDVFNELIEVFKNNSTLINRLHNLLIEYDYNIENPYLEEHIKEDEFIRVEVFEYASNWISELLSPTYIHSDNKKGKSPESNFKGHKLYAPHIEIINELIPETALKYLIKYVEESTKKIVAIQKELFNYKNII